MEAICEETVVDEVLRKTSHAQQMPEFFPASYAPVFRSFDSVGHIAFCRNRRLLRRAEAALAHL